MKLLKKIRPSAILPSKRIILLATLAIASFVSIMAVGPTYAYLKVIDDTPTTNQFSASQSVTPEILETFDHTTKSNVAVKVGDTGYAVYVRAAVVVTWKKGNEVLGTKPVEGVDYTLDPGNAKWELKSDGYYYYSDPVASGDTTELLIKSLSVCGPAPEEGFTLSVEIIAQTIQAEGETDGDERVLAVTDAWGYTPAA